MTVCMMTLKAKRDTQHYGLDDRTEDDNFQFATSNGTPADQSVDVGYIYGSGP
jgi:hypothetical protein